jgi:hypothetical protein
MLDELPAVPPFPVPFSVDWKPTLRPGSTLCSLAPSEVEPIADLLQSAQFSTAPIVVEPYRSYAPVGPMAERARKKKCRSKRGKFGYNSSLALHSDGNSAPAATVEPFVASRLVVPSSSQAHFFDIEDCGTFTFGLAAALEAAVCLGPSYLSEPDAQHVRKEQQTQPIPHSSEVAPIEVEPETLHNANIIVDTADPTALRKLLVAQGYEHTTHPLWEKGHCWKPQPWNQTASMIHDICIEQRSHSLQAVLSCANEIVGYNLLKRCETSRTSEISREQPCEQLASTSIEGTPNQATYMYTQ